MEVKLSVGRYVRIVQQDFTEATLMSYAKKYDYVFAVSRHPFPDNTNADVIQKKSAIVRILDDEEAQLSNYKSTCRNEVRRSFRTPELSVEIINSDFDECYDFHKTCEKERKWKPVPFEELESSLIICVRYREELIAGMSAFFGDDTLRVGRIFSRRRSNKYNDIQKVVFSMAARRVVHELTRWGASKGLKYLDLGGVDLDDESKKGITRFKLYFGAEIIPVYLCRIKGPNYEALENYCYLHNLDLT